MLHDRYCIAICIYCGVCYYICRFEVTVVTSGDERSTDDCIAAAIVTDLILGQLSSRASGRGLTLSLFMIVPAGTTT
jgi:hypothetical protein